MGSVTWRVYVLLCTCLVCTNEDFGEVVFGWSVMELRNDTIRGRAVSDVRVARWWRGLQTVTGIECARQGVYDASPYCGWVLHSP